MGLTDYDHIADTERMRAKSALADVMSEAIGIGNLDGRVDAIIDGCINAAVATIRAGQKADKAAPADFRKAR